MWFEGKLADKVVSGFTSAENLHGGRSPRSSGVQRLHGLGSIVVPTGYTSEGTFAAGGNPYGVCSTESPTEEELAASRYQGRRITRKTWALAGSRVQG